MSKVIYKYPLETVGEQTVVMPDSAQIIEVNTQGGKVFAWALIEDGDVTKNNKKILMVGTGWETDADFEDFLGTIYIGPFVWHFFKG